MAWLTFFVLAAKLAGAAKEMAVAYRYGIGVEVDAYLFVLNVISWPIGVWFSVLTVVLVPLVGRIRKTAPQELARFRAELFGIVIVMGGVLAFVAWIGLPLLLGSHGVGLPHATADIVERTMRPLVSLLPLGVIISLFSASMLAAGRQANTCLEGVPALVIIIAVLTFTTGGIEPLVWGTVAGGVAHMVSLAIPLAFRGEIVAPRFTHHSPQWIPFWQGFGIMLAGQALMSVIVVVDQFFVVHLGMGNVATLSYANRVLSLLLTLGGTAVSRATLPVFSRVQGREGMHVYRMALKWAHLMLLVGAAAAALSWWLAPFIVQCLFERGAFTAHHSLAVMHIVRYAVLQLPFYFAGLVLVSSLVSQGMHRLVALGAIANLAVKLTANWLLVPIMGINGVVAATVLMYAVSFVTLYAMVMSALHRKGHV